MNPMLPLVTIITATWRRPHLLSRCMASVHAQTYRPLEHIVVSDGPDYETAARVAPAIATYQDASYYLLYAQLAQHMTTRETGTGTDAFRRGCVLASGELIFFLPDDDLLVPTAIAKLVAACTPAIDFTYSQVAMHGGDEAMTLESGWICGANPPQHGGITNFLFRKALLELGEYPNHPTAPDWMVIEQWIQAKKMWDFVPEVLQVHHYDPHMG